MKKLNTAFWAVMVGCATITAFGIYDGSGLEIGIGLGIAAITIVWTIIGNLLDK